jgi:hypothetical protein
MYVGYEQVTATAATKTVNDLTVPSNATHAELQADTQNVRYTMDNSSGPSQTVGMVLVTTHAPKLFLIEDIRRIRFQRGAGSDGVLNVHYISGRNV